MNAGVNIVVKRTAVDGLFVVCVYVCVASVVSNSKVCSDGRMTLG